MKIEGCSVVFEWKGNARRVFVGGDFNNFRREPLRKVSDNYWILEKTLPEDGRFDYLFFVDGKQKLDPENPLTQAGGFGVKSELRMPGFSYPEYVLEKCPEEEEGKVSEFSLFDPVFNYNRKVIIYEPKSNASRACELLIFQDGTDYVNYASAVKCLDNMIRAKKIPPVYAVFAEVRGRTRGREYTNYRKYSLFLKQVLVDEFRKRTGGEPERITLIGASLGGHVSLSCALAFPDLFMNVISQSGAFFTKLPEPNVAYRGKFYMSCGVYETALGGRFDLLKMNREVSAKLKEKGLKVKYREFNDGHSYGNWKACLPEALEFVLAEAQW